MIKPMIYLAGDMLNRGAQLQRAEEKEALKALGYPLYVPQDNKEINDKGSLNSEDGLAEKIVKADTSGIQASDIIVMEAREAALGTCIELGQIKGQRDFAQMVLETIEDYWKSGTSSISIIEHLCKRELDKEVLIHNSDIRRTGNPTETGDRRAYGPHQYMYGVVLDVTNGEGYTPFNKILEKLGDA